MDFIIPILAKLPTMALVSLAAIAVIIGDFAAKSWSLDRSETWYWIALIGYFLSGFFFIPSLLKEGLVITSLAWVVLSTIGFLFIGLVIFKETLTPLQTVGIVFGLVSIVILTVAE